VDLRIDPGARLEGTATVPGDKSIAHRWLILAATAGGTSRLTGLPGSLDVRSTAASLAALSRAARPSLEAWVRNGGVSTKGHGSTWNPSLEGGAESVLEVEGDGWGGLEQPVRDLDCGNSGTSMRLLAAVAAGAAFPTVLVGDRSLSARPMERIAEPLRLMGATVHTTSGHAPLRIEGGDLHGIRYSTAIPSAQVKSAVLLAGLVAAGDTVVEEPASTRDHTERVLAALGAPIRVDGGSITVSGFQHGAFEGVVPGDPSSSAFLVAAAALTGGDLTISALGLNPTRLAFLDVMQRMGVKTRRLVKTGEMGEPVGELLVARCPEILPTRIEDAELSLVIDEVPVLALLAAHARGDSWFLGAGELRVKESDRLAGVARIVNELGGHASVEGNDLVIAGGGLEGGVTHSDDHRLGMAAAVGALGARSPSRVGGIEAADVSFPGFVEALRSLGARAEVTG
jgi:3-phosphoshikimate 1-carboxyvinyltransferase